MHRQLRQTARSRWREGLGGSDLLTCCCGAGGGATRPSNTDGPRNRKVRLLTAPHRCVSNPLYARFLELETWNDVEEIEEVLRCAARNVLTDSVHPQTAEAQQCSQEDQAAAKIIFSQDPQDVKR